jgi:predicted unusual protein kinase regulating ubiquinone biosynthesis (AarF/ABC1/UbiB family)
MLPTTDVDYRSFKRSSIEVIRVWTERSHEPQASPAERHLGTVMLRTMAAMRLHGVRPAPEFLLFWRVLFQVDSMALEMGDSVDMFAVVRRFFERDARSAWYRIDGSAHRVPVDAAPTRKAVDRGADLADASRPRMPHNLTQTSSRRARSVKMRRTLLPTFAIFFVAFAVLLSGIVK